VLELIEDRPLSQGGHRNLGPIWAELWTPAPDVVAVQSFKSAFSYVTDKGIHFQVGGPHADFVRRDVHDLGAWWPPRRLPGD
jgi:hypothetical protein